MNKICSHCKTDQSINNFSKWKYSPDGLSNQCKSCSSKRHRIYNQKLAYKTKSFYLYKIINQINDKIYIGKTIDINKRWRAHKSNPFSDNKIKANELPKLYRSIRKYGINNFKFEIIEIFSNEQECSLAEIEYIKNYNTVKNGLNTSYGGDGAGCGINNPMFGKHHSEKTKTKISNSLSGRKCPFITGSKNPASKLTESIVIKIRFEYNSNNKSLSELVEIFHIPKQTLFNIVKRLTWKHI